MKTRRAASGHAAATSPRSVMNSRRRMSLPSDEAHNLAHHWALKALCIAAKSSRLCRFRVITGGAKTVRVEAAPPLAPDIRVALQHFAFVPTD
jgi:hypothetical protein